LFYKRNGVNLRHLGKVRQLALKRPGNKLDIENVARKLLEEMVVRTCKNAIREQLRRRMLELNDPKDEPVKETVLLFLNLMGNPVVIITYLITIT